MDTKGRIVGYRAPLKRAKRVRESVRPAWVHEKEVYAVVGAAIEVLNTIGHGFHEKPYEVALAVECALRKIPFRQQPRYSILFKGREVGEFVPDLIVFDKVVVEAKVIDRITDHERGQMINYLKITGCRVGVILNFAHAKLEWERLVL